MKQLTKGAISSGVECPLHMRKVAGSNPALPTTYKNMKKIFGWIILIIGILVIVWGIWTSYQIFTGQIPVYEVFTSETIEGTSLADTKINLNLPMEEQIQQIIKDQIGQIIPQESMFKFFNLGAWWIFMMILMLGGGKLAIIGVNLLKGE